MGAQGLGFRVKHQGASAYTLSDDPGATKPLTASPTSRTSSPIPCRSKVCCRIFLRVSATGTRVSDLAHLQLKP